MHRIAVLTAPFLLLALACSEDATSPFDLSGVDRTILVDFTGDVGRWPHDPVTIKSTQIRGDTLVLDVQYGGGCRRHDFALIAWNGWLETVPVQAGVFLAHNANGDACEALIHETLRFLLVPLRASFELHYRSPHGRVGIRFQDPRTPQPSAPNIIYWDF